MPIGIRRQLQISALVAVAASLLASSAANAQNLPLKRALPEQASPCPVEPAFRLDPPSPDDRAEAERLGRAAGTVLIVGDLQGARENLERAVRRDPTNAEIAYTLGRTLEDLGERDAALGHYCRVLLLEPAEEDRREVEARLERLAAETSITFGGAFGRFQQGVQEFDAERLTESERSFSAALRDNPDWPEALYNRGVVYAAMGRRQFAVRDLWAYLDLRPAAADRGTVVAAIRSLEEGTPLAVPTASPPAARPAPSGSGASGSGPSRSMPVNAGTDSGSTEAERSGVSPGGALGAGLLIPGMGHFYTKRPAKGFVYLTLAGGAAAAGVLYRETTIVCGTPTVEGECPPGSVLDEETERPYLWTGVGVAALVTVWGAVDAYRGAKAMHSGHRALAAIGGSEGPRLGLPGIGGARAPALLLPALHATPVRLRVQLLRLRF